MDRSYYSKNFPGLKLEMDQNKPSNDAAKILDEKSDDFSENILKDLVLLTFKDRRKHFPLSIYEIRNLTNLDIRWAKLLNLPEAIGYLTNLKDLNISNNILKTLPESIGNLTNLKKLDISVNPLNSIPDSIGKLINLNYLKAIKIGLKEFPASFCRLKNLVQIDVGLNHLDSLPDNFGNLTCLEFFHASDNQFINLPKAFATSRNLRSIDLTSNLIDAIDTITENNFKLEYFYISDNQLRSLPSSISNLRNLKDLEACSNNIEFIPDDIGQLEYLKTFNVAQNKLKSLPSSIGNLQNLARLNASKNQLSKIPETIGNLKKLAVLDVSSNCIRNIPNEICGCLKLNQLILDNNKDLEYLPEKILNLPELWHIFANECGLLYLPALVPLNLKNMLAFENVFAYIPIIYENFSTSQYEYIIASDNTANQYTNKLNSAYFLIKEKRKGTTLLLPFGTRSVHHPTERIVFSLFELALQIACKLEVDENVTNLYDDLPLALKDYIKKGPIVQCCFNNCYKRLYTEYYLLIVKRLHHRREFLFSCNFCTVSCAHMWYQANKTKYDIVMWTVLQ